MAFLEPSFLLEVIRHLHTASPELPQLLFQHQQWPKRNTIYVVAYIHTYMQWKNTHENFSQLRKASIEEPLNLHSPGQRYIWAS